MLSDSRSDRAARRHGHVPPEWVNPEATFFVTINCQKRGINQLTIGDLPAKLFSSVSHYHNTCRWWPEIVLLMPDHLHALVSFSWQPKNGMNTVLRDWKRYTARHFGIGWQRDYFDHRIRNKADHTDKWQYIRENPVRSGLVETYDQWTHVWFPDRIGWQGRESASAHRGN
jgi:putative transposase